MKREEELPLSPSSLEEAITSDGYRNGPDLSNACGAAKKLDTT